MNLLLISKPGIPLLRSLRESETAWDAIRFYGPVGLSIGVYIPVSTLAGALSLASDLRYFLKKYTSDHLFQIKPGVYYTAALTRSRYLSRDDDVSEDWPFKLIYWVENLGKVIRVRKEEWNIEEMLYQTSEPGEEDTKQDDVDITCGYLLEIWCTKPEFEIV
nr:hypothetical protein [uncultured Methanospirillum sp.]